MRHMVTRILKPLNETLPCNVPCQAPRLGTSGHPQSHRTHPTHRLRASPWTEAHHASPKDGRFWTGFHKAESALVFSFLPRWDCCARSEYRVGSRRLPQPPGSLPQGPPAGSTAPRRSLRRARQTSGRIGEGHADRGGRQRPQHKSRDCSAAGTHWTPSPGPPGPPATLHCRENRRQPTSRRVESAMDDVSHGPQSWNPPAPRSSVPLRPHPRAHSSHPRGAGRWSDLCCSGIFFHQRDLVGDVDAWAAGRRLPRRAGPRVRAVGAGAPRARGR